MSLVSHRNGRDTSFAPARDSRISGAKEEALRGAPAASAEPHGPGPGQRRLGAPFAPLGSTPVSIELGRLVDRAVANRRRRAASDASGEAVDDARVVVSELSAPIARLELTQPNRPGSLTLPERSDVAFD